MTTLVVYLPVAWHGFVDYDDGDYVTGNSHVQSGLKWVNVKWGFTTGHASNWHPLTWLSHMSDAQLFGARPGPQHLESVLFHVANTVLLFLLLGKITRFHWRSAIVAGLFALHPIHVESVAWISERKDVLSGLFFMLTLWAYSDYVERVNGRGTETEVESPSSHVPPGRTSENNKSKVQSPKSKVQCTTASVVSGQWSVVSGPWSVVRGPVIWYLAALIFFALGLMSKPMLVTVPFVLVLLDFWPLKRVSCHPLRLAWLLVEKVPFLGLSIVSCLVTFRVQRKGGAVSNVLTFWQETTNAAVSYARYIRKIFWPSDLSVLYPHPGDWPLIAIVVSSTLLLGITIAVVAAGRKRPYLAMGWFWFTGMLVPVIGLVQVGLQSMADRYTYLPSIGFFIAIVWGVAEAWAALREDRSDRSEQSLLWLAGSASGIVLVSCALMTLIQVGYWKNTQTLFERGTNVTARNYLAYNNLGFYFENNKQPERALTNYLESLKINPNYEEALNNYGHILAGRKQYAEAIAYYEKALRVKPDQVEIHNNLGNALSETGKIDEAIEHYRFALNRKPDHADAHNNLGIALAMKGKLDEAIEHFHAAIQLKPADASAHSNLGNALAAKHNFSDAINEFQESLRLKPDEAQPHNNLGNVLAEEGRMDEAIVQYAAALRIQPNDPEAHYNLALALLRQGKGQDARGHLLEALRIRPNYRDARAQLDALKLAR